MKKKWPEKINQMINMLPKNFHYGTDTAHKIFPEGDSCLFYMERHYEHISICKLILYNYAMSENKYFSL